MTTIKYPHIKEQLEQRKENYLNRWIVKCPDNLNNNNQVIRSLVNKIEESGGVISLPVDRAIERSEIYRVICDEFRNYPIDPDDPSKGLLLDLSGRDQYIKAFLEYAIYSLLDSTEQVNESGRILKRLLKGFKELRDREQSTQESSIISRLLAYYPDSSTKTPLEYPEIMNKIGNRIGKLYLTDTVEVLVSDGIYFDSDSYGQRHSCWYGVFLDQYFKSRGLALLMEQNSRDYGRVWLYPVPDSDSVIMFNAYDKLFGDSIRTFNKIIKSLLPDIRLSEIDLENHGTTSGNMYLNGGGTIMTLDPEIELPTFYDFKLGSELQSCYECGSEHDDDDLYEYNGHLYCDNCTFYCEECNETYPTGRISRYETDDGYTVCESCANEYYVKCGHCGKLVRIP